MTKKPIFGRFGDQVIGFFNDKNRGFSRFHDDAQNTQPDAVKTTEVAEATELSMFSNGKVGKGGNGSHNMSGSDGNGYTGMLEVEEDTGETPKKKRNEITAWQAGWNVTNAIQVRATMLPQSSQFNLVKFDSRKLINLN